MIKMMNEIMIDGKQEFMGVDVPNVLGGFGDGKKAISDKIISEIHGVETFRIKEIINRNIDRFKNGVDFIDLIVIAENEDNPEMLKSLGYTNMQISKSKNLYLLSERGYAKIIKIMDSDLAWEIHDKLISEYFDMREKLTISDEHMALINIVQSESDAEMAIALRDYKNVVQAPLQETIAIQQPKVDLYEDFMSKDNLYSIADVSRVLGIKGLGRTNFHKYLRENEILMTDLYKGKGGMNHFTAYANHVNTHQHFKHRRRQMGKTGLEQNVAHFTPSGVEYIYKKLIRDGYTTERTIEEVMSDLEQ